MSQLAATRAVSLNQVRRVRLDASTGRFLVEKQLLQNGRDEFAPVDDVPGSQGQLDARIAVEFHPPETLSGEATPVDGSSAWAGDATRTIINFYPDGTADPGAFLLRDRQGFSLLLRINPVTTRVRVVALAREVSP